MIGKMLIWDGVGSPLKTYSGEFLSKSQWEEVRDSADAFYESVSDEQVLAKNTRIQWCNVVKMSFSQFRKGSIAGFVYLIRDGISYKIGRSVSPKRRMCSLGLSEDSELIHRIYTGDTVTLERAFHSWFSSKNEHGEWFSLNSDDIEFFKWVDSSGLVEINESDRIYCKEWGG